jgi:Na+-driven multidrug efflux pump
MNDSGRSIIFENIHKTIFKLSFPGMVSSVLQTLYQIIDAYWVGKLGPEALAAIGGASFVLWAILSLTALSINGITTLVAQNIGAGKEDAAKYAAGQGLLLST